MTGPFITIRRYGSGHIRGYRWVCSRCDVYGIHRFGRWTDYVHRNRPDPHPWRRCIDAVDLHLWRYHRRPAVVTVHVDVTT